MSSKPPQIKFVDTVDLVHELVTEIVHRDKKPLLFVDLEGVNLSRDGSVAIMQVLVPPNPTVYLVDVHVLQAAAFDTVTKDGQSLKAILESTDYAKVFFDVRNDSDALYSHFDVHLGGVIDLQLLEFATRPGYKRPQYVQGLAKCITYSGILSWQEARTWEQVKDVGVRQFAPEKGGTYEVFLRRPLSKAMQRYCAEDVLKMPPLLCFYAARITATTYLAHQVAEEALRRVRLSQSPNYNPHGKQKAVGPVMNWQRCARLIHLR